MILPSGSRKKLFASLPKGKESVEKGKAGNGGVRPATDRQRDGVIARRRLSPSKRCRAGINARGPIAMPHLYHVTPRKNLLSILSSGLTPKASRGRRKVIWLCSGALLPWTLDHLAEYHDCHISELAILKVEVLPGEVSRQRRGIYCSTVHIGAYRLYDQLSC